MEPITIMLLAAYLTKVVTTHQEDMEYARHGQDSPRYKMKLAKLAAAQKAGQSGGKPPVRPGASGYMQELWRDAWEDLTERRRRTRQARKADAQQQAEQEQESLREWSKRSLNKGTDGRPVDDMLDVAGIRPGTPETGGSIPQPPTASGRRTPNTPTPSREAPDAVVHDGTSTSYAVAGKWSWSCRRPGCPGKGFDYDTEDQARGGAAAHRCKDTGTLPTEGVQILGGNQRPAPPTEKPTPHPEVPTELIDKVIRQADNNSTTGERDAQASAEATKTSEFGKKVSDQLGHMYGVWCGNSNCACTCPRCRAAAKDPDLKMCRTCQGRLDGLYWLAVQALRKVDPDGTRGEAAEADAVAAIDPTATQHCTTDEITAMVTYARMRQAENSTPAGKPAPDVDTDDNQIPDNVIPLFPNAKETIMTANAEATGLPTAIAFADAAASAHQAFATGGSEGYTNALAGFEVGPEGIDSAREAQEASTTAAAKWSAHKEILENQQAGREFYQSNPDAGNKSFLTGE